MLSVRNLVVSGGKGSAQIDIVSDVSFEIERGKVLGLVGESGSGKSITSLAVMGLLPHPQLWVRGGSIELDGADITEEPPYLRVERGHGGVAMIFQEPMTSLNPVLPIGEQIVEAVRVHDGSTGVTARNRAQELLDMVRIPDARLQLNAYPHELSGGMRQRVMIAIALACRPQALIADEPTTALDVTVQLQVLSLIRELCDTFDMGVLFITHDLGVVSELADSVAVMYGGKIVETGPVERLFNTPLHPYTAGLMGCVPDPSAGHRRFQTIPGQAPKPGEITHGCRFAPRCSHAQAICSDDAPTRVTEGARHFAECHFPISRGA
ncbi:ABC transporter ATP-binding protein [Tropicimonas sp. IMCC6043]|uniref:ABC transporter ATP-binding protein n=1 Tax=Tropicimonas sp. IMCC6043 TaxID=2510645 RepID=UPI00101DDEAE|nr:ABC transporter ATP-binding protein [Tropicimonas sp. IMCC6043]RYH07542.1 ABC transporter ATP-binding protein [Tropicimonas sp. IMCC6043]